MKLLFIKKIGCMMRFHTQASRTSPSAPNSKLRRKLGDTLKLLPLHYRPSMSVNCTITRRARLSAGNTIWILNGSVKGGGNCDGGTGLKVSDELGVLEWKFIF